MRVCRASLQVSVIDRPRAPRWLILHGNLHRVSLDLTARRPDLVADLIRSGVVRVRPVEDTLCLWRKVRAARDLANFERSVAYSQLAMLGRYHHSDLRSADAVAGKSQRLGVYGNV